MVWPALAYRFPKTSQALLGKEHSIFSESDDEYYSASSSDSSSESTGYGSETPAVGNCGTVLGIVLLDRVLTKLDEPKEHNELDWKVILAMIWDQMKAGENEFQSESEEPMVLDATHWNG